MSPLSRLPSHVKYCTTKGLSRPNSALALSIISCETVPLVFSIFCSTTSLPAIRIMP